MNLLMAYTKTSFLATFRNKQAAFFSILFPVVLLLIFGSQDHIGGGLVNRIAIMAVYANYAAQSVAFLSLGIGISAERNSDWNLYLRTLPVNPGTIFLGKIFSRIALMIISLILILSIGTLFFQFNLGLLTLSYIFIIAVIGAIPMALLGIAVAYWVEPESARFVFVIMNLGLLFGSFALSSHGIAATLKQFIPSYQWMMMTVSHYSAGSNQLTPWLSMAAFSALFYWLAKKSYSRQRNLRFS